MEQDLPSGAAVPRSDGIGLALEWRFQMMRGGSVIVVGVVAGALLGLVQAVSQRRDDPGGRTVRGESEESCRSSHWRFVTTEELDRVVISLSHILVRHKDASRVVALFPKDWMSTTALPERTREEAMRLALTIHAKTQRMPKSFGSLASQYSEDVRTRDNGGEVEPLSAAQLSLWPPVLDAIAELPRGEVSKVVETEFGFHIFMLRSQPADMLVGGKRIVIGHAEAGWLKYAARREIVEREPSVARMLAERLREEVRQGKATFGQLVDKYSEHRDAEQGGDIGVWSTREPSPLAREARVLSFAEIGEVVGPFDSPVGYEVLLRTDVRQRETFAMEALRLAFDPVAPADSPNAEPSVRLKASDLYERMRAGHANFDDLRSEYCCEQREQWTEGRGPPGMTAALLAVAIGEIAQPVKSEWNYVIARRLEPKVLTFSYNVPLPERPDLRSFISSEHHLDWRRVLKHAANAEWLGRDADVVNEIHTKYLTNFDEKAVPEKRLATFERLQNSMRSALGNARFPKYQSALEAGLAGELLSTAARGCRPPP